jgi:hypothetical protein
MERVLVELRDTNRQLAASIGLALLALIPLFLILWKLMR